MPDLIPARHQPPLPQDDLLLRTAPDEENVPMDVVFVGGGPAALAGAIRLAQLAQENEALSGLEIGVLEKAEELGQHSISGAVIDPRAFRALFPDLSDSDFPFRRRVESEKVYFLRESGAWRIPTPPPMKNHGNYTASLAEAVRWLGEKAEGLGVNVFTGYPAASLLVEDERVVGVRTTPSGLGRDGSPAGGYTPPTDITARVVALAEGSRGSLSQAWMDWQGVTSKNPQIFALGVKEVWETKRPLESVIHTLGWPLPRSAFGGTFFYPLADNLVTLGVVVGLDYRPAALDVHVLLQRLKTHPLVKPILEGGEMIEWGAKTIPEGGWYSLPDVLHGDGALLLGDAAGFVDVPSLKGIHYAMESGIAAAETIAAALAKDDVSASALAGYTERMRSGDGARVLKRRRNMRLAFKSGFFLGGLKSLLMTLTLGAFPGWRIGVKEDAEEPREAGPPQPFVPDGELTFSKVDAVYRSGNQTRDDIPSHLIVGEDIPPDLADLYHHLCPAGVYERDGKKLVVNAPNCVDCKATDVLGPRWTPREGGSGPRYKRM